MPPFIFVEESIKEFGYDPRRLKPNSYRLVVTNCESCKKKRIKKYKHALSQRSCAKCANTKRARASAAHRSASMKGYYAAGGKHPLKGIGHTAASKKKMSESQRRLPRKPLSDARRKQLSEDCYRILNNPKNQEKARRATKAMVGILSPHYGQIPAHTRKVWHTNPEGKRICFRSAWEAAFAELLDAQKKRWEYETKTFPINYNREGIPHAGTYTPDFKTAAGWVEIKGRWTPEGEAKFAAFHEQYPLEQIRVVDRAELTKLGLFPRIKQIYKETKPCLRTNTTKSTKEL